MQNLGQMQIYANVCKCMQMYANVCKFMQMYANLCKCMQIYANLCVTDEAIYITISLRAIGRQYFLF